EIVAGVIETGAPEQALELALYMFVRVRRPGAGLEEPEGVWAERARVAVEDDAQTGGDVHVVIGPVLQPLRLRGPSGHPLGQRLVDVELSRGVAFELPHLVVFLPERE